MQMIDLGYAVTVFVLAASLVFFVGFTIGQRLGYLRAREEALLAALRARDNVESLAAQRRQNEFPEEL